MKLPDDIAALAKETVETLIANGLTIATAESCTGGLIAGALTAISGSSETVYGGFVSYANEAKIAMIGVPYALLKQHGAVSKEVAIAMAEGALGAAGTHIAVAVTGIAGPNGGSADKPVGLVWFGIALAGQPVVAERQLFGQKGREFIRHETVRHALQLGLRALGQDRAG